MGDVPRLSQTIRWSHDRSGRLGRAAQTVLYTIVDLVQFSYRGGTDNVGISAASADLVDPRVDSEPYGHVLVTGTAAGLPPTADGAHLATVWRSRLTVATAEGDVELPVSTLRLTGSPGTASPCPGFGHVAAWAGAGTTGLAGGQEK